MATLNFNVGVLGHIDSGKTSLAKVLSTVASTASFDKNPQSKERGITLDLGFSSFTVPIPDRMKDGTLENLQYTLVDCPGHASLIRTIIGGAQIIDLMMLVVDVTKGMQTQTAECLVIGEILCEKMIVVLNKVDLIATEKRTAAVEKMTKRLNKTFENTKFADSPIIPVAAKPGGPEAPDSEGMGVDVLIATLMTFTYQPVRSKDGPFIFAVDHCFPIRGQGTVMTGTVLSGAVCVNDNVEIPPMKVHKKVRSIQMFKKSVNEAMQGDRLGICVTQFDPKQLERGLVCTPNALPTIVAGLIRVKKIPYYKGTIATKAKFHITLGHETVMGRVSFFGTCGEVDSPPGHDFDFERDYSYQEELVLESFGRKDAACASTDVPVEQYAIVEFERPVTCAEHCMIIGSRFDADIHSNSCRLAFHGTLLEAISDVKYSETILPRVKIFKNKMKDGIVERKMDDYTVICRGLFKKESKIETFVGLKVVLSTGENGIIEGGFGQSGKFKVRINSGLSAETSLALEARAKKNKKSENATAETPQETIYVVLNFKRYIYDPKKLIMQT